MKLGSRYVFLLIAVLGLIITIISLSVPTTVNHLSNPSGEFKGLTPETDAYAVLEKIGFQNKPLSKMDRQKADALLKLLKGRS